MISQPTPDDDYLEKPDDVVLETFQETNLSQAMQNIGYAKAIVKVLELGDPMEISDSTPVTHLVVFDAEWTDKLRANPSHRIPTSRDFRNAEDAIAFAKQAINETDYWNTSKYD